MGLQIVHTHNLTVTPRSLPDNKSIVQYCYSIIYAHYIPRTAIKRSKVGLKCDKREIAMKDVCDREAEGIIYEEKMEHKAWESSARVL
jgi:hypothetical protein